MSDNELIERYNMYMNFIVSVFPLAIIEHPETFSKFVKEYNLLFFSKDDVKRLSKLNCNF